MSKSLEMARRLLREGSFSDLAIKQSEGKRLGALTDQSKVDQAKKNAYEAGHKHGTDSGRSFISRAGLGNLSIAWPHSEFRDHYYSGFKQALKDKQEMLK